MKSDFHSEWGNGRNSGSTLHIKKRLKSTRLVNRKPAESRKLHPDHSIHLKRFNRVMGQIKGIKRMIEHRRYCPDILIQMRAAASALKAIELVMLETHLRHCFSDALDSQLPAKASSKVEELIKVVGRF